MMTLLPVDMMDHLNHYLIPRSGPIYHPDKHYKMTYANQNRKAKKRRKKKNP